MSYPLLPAVLGLTFLLVWAFIGIMILRDGQHEVRRRQHLEPKFSVRPRDRRSRLRRAVSANR